MDFHPRHWRSDDVKKKFNVDKFVTNIFDYDAEGSKTEYTQKKITVLGFNGIRQYTIKEAIEMLKEGRIFDSNLPNSEEKIDKPISKEGYVNE
jgi:hypothetical protein